MARHVTGANLEDNGPGVAIDDVHLVRPRLETLRTLACPFALLLGPTEISVWPVGPTLQRHAAEAVAYEDLAPYLSRRDYLFGPSNALRAKSAGLQLDLFSIGPGLIHFARQVTPR